MMDTFLSIHRDEITGTLSMFDRMIFKGHLLGFMGQGAFGAFLSRQGILLKDFGKYAQESTQTLKAHLEGLAQEAGRPWQYLPTAPTHQRRPGSLDCRAGWCHRRIGLHLFRHGNMYVLRCARQSAKLQIGGGPSSAEMSALLLVLFGPRVWADAYWPAELVSLRHPNLLERARVVGSAIRPAPHYL